MLVLRNHHLYKPLKAIPHSPQSEESICEPSVHEKILPLRIIHQKVYKSQDIHKSLKIRAHKHISKVSAVGPETAESLNYIQHSKSVKTIRNFEFDPYLAGASCISELIKTFGRIKNVREANIVIRRMDKTDYDNRRKFLLHKLRRLTKLRTEFVYDGQIVSESPYFVLQNIAKCYGLKSLTILVINLPFAIDKACYAFAEYRRNLLRLEELQMVKYKNYTVLNPYDKLKHDRVPPIRLTRLKKISISLGIKPGWISANDNDVNSNFAFLDYFRNCMQLEELNIKLIKFPTVVEFLIVLLEIIPTLPNLKRIKFNFIKSQIGDSEIIEITNVMQRLPNIHHLAIKIFQFPILSGDAIKASCETLAKNESLKKLDFYIRKLGMTETEIEKLTDDIDSIGSFEICRFQQSFHVFNRKQLE